jgi:hypothetical protein
MVKLYYFRKKSGLIRFIWITFFWIPLRLGVFFGLFWYFFGLFWYFFGLFWDFLVLNRIFFLVYGKIVLLSKKNRV